MTKRTPADGVGVHDDPVPGQPAGASATGASPRPRRRMGPSITFVQWADASAVAWTVMEVDSAGVPGARRSRCLVFARESCIRRVWDYPANWRTLDDAALAALSWGR